MRAFLILILFIISFQCTFIVYGQGSNNSNQNVNVKPKLTRVISRNFCATDYLNAELFKKFPSLKEQQDSIDYKIYLLKDRKQRFKRSSHTYIIPVVVHIIHNNGPENISDNLVLDGIQHLNDAFANVGFYDPTTGVDVEIQFCLAMQNENGEFSTGINRVESILTDMITKSQDLDVKNLSRWDPTKYLNFWLVNEITSQSMGSGVAGYAYFPSAHGTPVDGIMVEARWFGSSPDNSKIHVHEVGHYLGLYHTFQSGCANNNCLIDGDRVCDTPPDASTAAVSCNTSINTCTTDEDDISVNNPFRPIANGGLGDQDDMFIDYMDYGYQSCQSAFTAGQKDRMIAVLTGTRSSLLDSKGCMDLCTSFITASFLVSDTLLNVGSTIVLANTSTGATSYQWQINGSTFSTSQDTSYTFNTQGNYTIKLIASNSDSACTEVYSEIVEVICPITASFTANNTMIYPGDTVTFTNTSTGAVSCEWLLGGISISTSVNLTYKFDSVGFFILHLVASNNVTCEDTSDLVIIRVDSCYSEAINSKRGNIWYFGNKAGLDFNSGSPVALTDGVMNAFEGCASIADMNGNLIFYSDGINVWNKDHQQMPSGNGLNGDPSASQSGLIVPLPGSQDMYYIFTIDAFGGTDGLQYSIVDMTLDNGNGDLIAKNSPLLAASTEKITACKHFNGEDIWIITHELNTNSFYVYLVSSKGLDTTPVISNVGSSHKSQGCLKASADGNMIGLAITANNIFELLDFDNATGMLSNPITFSNYSGAFGVEFSPDGTKLYGSTWYSARRIFQFDLEAGSPSDIINSVKLVATGTNSGGFGAIQLANDGMIYVVKQDYGYLDVITIPNALGASCNYVIDGLYLEGMQGRLGLPNFEQSYFVQNDFSYSATCTDNFITFDLKIASLLVDSVLWYFGDPASGILNNSTVNNPTHLFSDTGKYEVMVIAYKPCITNDTVSKWIDVQSIRTVDFENNTVCLGAATDFTNLTVCDSLVNWAWNFGDGTPLDTSKDPTHLYTSSGNYDVTLIAIWNDGYTDNITKIVKVLSADTGYANFYWDSNCLWEVQFHDSSLGQPTSWQWDFGDSSSIDTTQNPLHGYGSQDTFLVTLIVDYNSGCPSDTISKLLYPVIILNDFFPKKACQGIPVTFTSDFDITIFEDYFQWDFGDGNWSDLLSPVHIYDSAGTYGVQVHVWYGGWNCYESVIDSVIVYPPPSLSLGEDTASCSISSIAFVPDSGFVSYKWQDGSTDSVFTATLPGIYWVEATDINGCSAIDTVEVLTINSPLSINLGNDTAVCQGNIVTLDAGSGLSSYIWQDGSSDQTYTTWLPGTYWVTGINSCGNIVSDTITISTDTTKLFTLGTDTSICEGSTVILATSTKFISYIWQDGSEDTVLAVSSKGIFWLEVANASGCNNRDSIEIYFLSDPTINLGKDTTICQGGSVNLNASGGTSYIWSPGHSLNDSTIATPVAKPDSTTTFKVTAFDICGRSDTANITISVIPELNILSGYRDTILKGESIILILAGGETYSWSPEVGLSCSNCSNPVASPEITTTYYVSVTDSNGCTYNDSIMIIVEYVAPNIFTPNGDGANDFLYFQEISGNGNSKYNLIIFNRWGQAVYRSYDYKNNWDGGILNPDVYYYILTNTATDAKYHGFIQLIR